MAAVQTAYTDVQPIGVHGSVADMSTYDADTGIVETVAGIGFGLAVSLGSAAGGIIIGGANLKGITVRDITLVHPSGTQDVYQQYDNAAIMVRGDMWILVGETIAATDPVYYVTATGVLQKTAASSTKIPHARWIRGASSGGIALLRLYDPMPDDIGVS